MALKEIFWPRYTRTVIKYPDPNGMAQVSKNILFQGQDVHLVRNGGSTGDLIDHIWIKDERTVSSVLEIRRLPASLALADGIITNLECEPVLLGGATFNQPTASDPPYSINGITVNKHTGEIIASPLGGGDPDHKKNFNFILKIKATGIDGNIEEQSIRIHVHDSLVSVWVTPDNLDVPASFAARLTLYAEFSSGLIGDITNHPGISWTSSNSTYLSFTAVSNGVHSGEFGCAFDVVNAANRTAVAGAQIDVGTLLNQTGSPIIANPSTIFIKDNWNTPGIPSNEPIAEFVGGPGKNKVDNVPNFLFLADGCKEGDKKNFKKVVKGIRRNMMRRPSKAPWNHLAKQVNFWILFMPSAEGAVSVNNEVVPVNIFKQTDTKSSYSGPIYTTNVDVSYPDPNLWGVKWLVNEGTSFNQIIKEVVRKEQKLKVWHGINTLIETFDSGLKNSNYAGIWEWAVQDESKPMTNLARYYATTFPPALAATDFNVSKLIGEVGLPTIYDEVLSKGDLITRWNSLYDHTIMAGNLKDYVLDAWKKLAFRKLLNKKNTALGTAFGMAPRADKSISELRGNERVCGYDRWERYHLDYLFKDIHLKSSSGATTDTWSDKVLDPIDPDWGTIYANLGKDFARIIVLSARTRRGGVQYQLYDNKDNFLGQGIFANMSDDSYLIPTINGVQLSIQEFEFPDKIERPQLGTVTHEMVHSYDLGDEYGSYETQLKVGSMFEYNIEEKQSLNLNMEKDVLVDEVDGMGDSLVNRGEINGDKIKWRWLRIQNAGVLLGSIVTGGGGTHVITLKKKQHRGFNVGDVVYLRKKDIGKVGLTGFTGGGSPIIDLYNQLPSHQYSPKLQITAISSGSSQITVSGFGMTPIADFPPESILVKLVDAVVKAKGTISTSGTTVTGLGSFFEAQVNPKTTTPMVGGSFIKVNIGGSDEIRKVQTVDSNTSLTIDAAFTSDLSNADYEIIQRDPATISSDVYKELLNFTIRNTINKTGNQKPMTEYPFVTVDITVDGIVHQEVKKTQLMIDATKNVYDLIDATDVKVAQHRNIVGLYRNGQDYTHAIFHPTGSCQMRMSHDEEMEVTLCPVCRYVLIDKIDPSKHSTLENQSNIYPEI